MQTFCRFLAVFGVAVALQAQTFERALEPGHCNAGEIYRNTMTGFVRICGPENVWSTVLNTDSNGNVAIGSTVIDAVSGATDPTPGLLNKWRIALAKARDGVSDAKILCVGDSTTEGLGGSTALTVAAYSAYPWRLASLLQSSGIVAAPGFARSTPVDNGNVHDNRWSPAANWITGAFFGFGQASVYNSMGLAGNLVFTPGGGITYDSFEIYYLQVAGGGTLTATGTGGTPAVRSTAGTETIASFTATAAAAATTNAVTISCSTAGGAACYVVGVEPYLSTTKRVRVGNAGVSGSTTAQWTDNGAWNSLQSIRSYAPDLTIIALGTNDAGTSVPASSVQANMQAIITAAQISGDVLLMTMPPAKVGVGAYATFEPLYQPVYAALSDSAHLPVVDIYQRFGGPWTTTHALMHNEIHPNSAGYWDVAGAVHSLLLRVQ